MAGQTILPRHRERLPMPKQILIVDDSPMVRRMVRTSVEAKTDWQVCGEAENGEVAIRMVEELNPDLVVLDLSMPVMNGLEAARHIAVNAPNTALLMDTMQDSGQLLKEAEDAGINEFITKSGEGIDRLLASMRALLSHPPEKIAHICRFEPIVIIKSHPSSSPGGLFIS